METLPHEIQCEILKGPLTLQDFLQMRATSTRIRQILDQCLVEIAGGEPGYLPPMIVTGLRKIEAISFDTSIYVTSYKQLLMLARHPTLRTATFDLTTLILSRSPEFQEGPLTNKTIYDLTIGFFKTSHQVQENGPQDCRERYNFTFVVRLNQTYVIQVSEGRLTFINLPLFYDDSTDPEPNPTPEEVDASLIGNYVHDLEDFFDELAERVPICEFVTDSNLAWFGLEKLPYLQRIYINYVGEFGLYYDELMPIKVAEYYVSIPKTRRLVSNVKDYDIHIVKEIIDEIILLTFVNITRFLPVPIQAVQNIARICPNLTSLSITLSSLERGIRDIDFGEEIWSVPVIYLVNNLLDPRDEDEYLSLFPIHLRNRISFVDSEW